MTGALSGPYLDHFDLGLGAQLLRQIRTQLLVLALLQVCLQLALDFRQRSLVRRGMRIQPEMV